MTPKEVWHRQVDEIAADYLETALRRRRPMTVVLRLDESGNVLAAKMTQEIEEAQRMERVKV